MARRCFAALLLALAAIAGLALGSATAAPVSYTLPAGTAATTAGFAAVGFVHVKSIGVAIASALRFPLTLALIPATPF